MTTIEAVIAASVEPSVVDVIVNGNESLATEAAGLLARRFFPTDSPTVRIWSTPLGGKAHAWNQYVHLIWPGSRFTFFVDGYARVKDDAFQLLAAALPAVPAALAGTGVPSSGTDVVRARTELLSEGGLRGAFFALKKPVMDELRSRNIRLPLGLYGFDTLLGAILAFGLDPARHAWDVRTHIFVHPDVTWTIEEKKWWRYAVVKTQWRRKLNNALRALVVQATKRFLSQRKMPPEQLPPTIEQFVLGWIEECPQQARQTLAGSPLRRWEVRKLRRPRDWSLAAQAPRLVYATRESAPQA
ncbi:hypothetical protein [Accumulibacter sp.]|uniref:hypothetical protein n=1 Tax=Accumulibacter sp. TaxID=2053492 RepID=UPI002613B656|nr:hypothetical protein [Accumulibacter sp.]